MTIGKARVLRTIDAARMLGVDDPEKFRLLARRAGVVGTKGPRGRLLWSQADVEAVRKDMAPRPTSWERILKEDE